MRHEEIFGESPFDVRALDDGALQSDILKLVLDYSGCIRRIDSSRQTVQTFRRSCIGVGIVDGRPALFCRQTSAKYASSADDFATSILAPETRIVDQPHVRGGALTEHLPFGSRRLDPVMDCEWRSVESRNTTVEAAFSEGGMLVWRQRKPHLEGLREVWTSLGASNQPRWNDRHVHGLGLLEDKLFVHFACHGQRERVVVLWDWRCDHPRVMELGDGWRGEFLVTNVGSDCVMLVRRHKKTINVVKFSLS